MRTQYELIVAMQDAGFNVVTCGQCGEVVLCYSNDEDIMCPHCGYTSEPCDFPDFYTREIRQYQIIKTAKVKTMYNRRDDNGLARLEKK